MTITPSISVSRSSGPAPLAVLVDAIGTTADGASDPFKDVTYYFHYGDDGCGNWRWTGKSKNLDYGAPIGSHVYETPGTYTITLACICNGEIAVTTETITVTDPDTVYSGTDTIVVSSSGTYGTEGVDYPTGATTQTTVPDRADFIDRRVLFRRGESFTLPKLPGNTGAINCQIGAFGPISAGYPQLTYTSLAISDGNQAGNWPRYVTYMDVQFVDTDLQGAGGGTGNSDGMFIEQFGLRDVLFSRVRFGVDNPPSNIPQVYFGQLQAFNGYVSTVPERYPWPRGITLYDCDVTIDPSASIYSNIKLFANACCDFVVMGCNINHTNTQSTRFSGYKFLIQHNKMPGKQIAGSNPRNIIKFQAQGAEEWSYTPVSNIGLHVPDDTGRFQSRYICIRSNLMGGEQITAGDFIALSQANADNVATAQTSYPEDIVDGVVEQNIFLLGSPTPNYHVLGSGRRITARDNIAVGDTFRFKQFDADDYAAIDATKKQYDWYAIYNFDNVVQEFEVGEVISGGGFSGVVLVKISATSYGINEISSRPSLSAWADDTVITGSMGGEATINQPISPQFYRYTVENEQFVGPYYTEAAEVPASPVTMGT